jgi:carboxyl-terminal processing protease
MKRTAPLRFAPPPRRDRKSFAATIGIAALCLAASCSKTDAPATEPTATPPAATDATETPPAGEDECRDWSSLDVSKLPALPQTPYTATFETAWKTVLDKHYDPTLSCLDWPALRLQYGKKLAEAKDEKAAYAIMNELLGELKQSHLMIVPPATETEGEVRGGVHMGPAVIPAVVRYLDGEVVIVDPTRYGLKSKLPAGAALVAVDDKPVATMVEQLHKTWKRDLTASFYIARTAQGWLTCPKGGSKKVEFRPHGSEKTKTKTLKCKNPDVERLSMGNIKDFPTTFESKMLPKKIGYIAFNIWLLPLAPRFQEAVHELTKKGMKGLVIDLRGNPGGVGMMVVPVARVLLPGPASLGEIRMREMKQEFKVLDVDDPFDGPVAVLIDERTGSTSEIFAAAMRELKRIKVYGASQSQGAALPSLIEELPGGARLQYVVADYASPGGNAVEGSGVKPDVMVPESAADYAAGHDPVLEAATQALAAE